MGLLRFARNDRNSRNDGDLNEIASVATLPRNDGNSRNDGIVAMTAIFAMTNLGGILEFYLSFAFKSFFIFFLLSPILS